MTAPACELCALDGKHRVATHPPVVAERTGWRCESHRTARQQMVRLKITWVDAPVTVTLTPGPVPAKGASR